MHPAAPSWQAQRDGRGIGARPDRHLLSRHRRFPPTAYERHRNHAILERQGNRDPLIDSPLGHNGSPSNQEWLGTAPAR
ncbi:endonuclease [Pseudoduganella sp. UC29_71]|uniref:endonuclease n=1 Tax=Pseudoduganella sp. UC29_71 TaxID=3350174 RepID=UPI00366E9AA6